MEAEVTKHAVDRIRERAKISRSSIQKMANRALNDGLSHKQVAGRLKRYIGALYHKNETANNIRLYGNYVYIFDRHVLITMWLIPQKFRSTLETVYRKSKHDPK